MLISWLTVCFSLVLFAQAETPFWGIADLHTHPMSHLGFGGKLISGSPDGEIRNALGSCRHDHGGWSPKFRQGNTLRMAVVNQVDSRNRTLHGALKIKHRHRGYPNFEDWPNFTTTTHQQMWVDWIHRAYQGGLRVMVGLATHNELLAAALAGDAPLDDQNSADTQIKAMKEFAQRHSDWMEVAFSSDDLKRIVTSGKLALVLGIEVDHLGRFNHPSTPKTPSAVRKEIQRLYQTGVRYLFPIHVLDNDFGGASVYQPLFNIGNRFGKTQFYPPEIGAKIPNQGFQVETAPDPEINFRLKPHMSQSLSRFLFGVLTGIEGNMLLSQPEYRIIKNYFLTPDFGHPAYARVPGGHRNAKGLTSLGRNALHEMMHLGLMIDIDHMSERAVDETLTLAEAIPGGYPLNCGHVSFRNLRKNKTEGDRTDSEIERIVRLGGLFGVGYNYDSLKNTSGTAHEVIQNSTGKEPKFYSRIKDSCPGSTTSFAQALLYSLEKSGSMALGTDSNGVVVGPGPRFESISQEGKCQNQSQPIRYPTQVQPLKTGNRIWDFNRDGMAHYGMLPDLIQDLKNVGMDSRDIAPLYQSAFRFYEMWRKSELAGTNLSLSAGE